MIEPFYIGMPSYFCLILSFDTQLFVKQLSPWDVIFYVLDRKCHAVTKIYLKAYL